MSVTSRACRLCLAMIAVSLSAPFTHAADPEWKPIRITGRVVDATGQPIRGVMCLWDWTGGEQAGRELINESETDADGRFELVEHEEAVADSHLRAQGTLWFLADGHAVHWQAYDRLPPISSNHRILDVVLKPAKRFSYRIIDPQGHPRIGELVEPMRLLNNRMMIQPSRPIRDRLSGTTDEAGVFVVNYLSRDQGMMVRVMSERFGTLQQSPNLTRGMPTVITLQLRRVAEVEGVVDFERPEEFAGRRVHLNTYQSQQPPPQFGLFGTTEATLDTRGRFRARAVPEGELSIDIEPLPGDHFETTRFPDKVEVKAGSIVKVSVPVIRRTTVTGRIRMTDDTVPSGTVEVSVPETGPGRSNKGQFHRNGDFQIGLAPGDVKIRAELQTLDGVPVAVRTLAAQATVMINKDDSPRKCPDLILPVARIVEGRAVTADGEPLVGATIYGQFNKESFVRFTTDATGRFRYAVAESTPPGNYLIAIDDRSLLALEKSEDPLVLRLPSSAIDNSSGR